MPAEAWMTAEELETLEMPGKSTELVRGRLIVREPPGTYHDQVAAKLLFRLGEQDYPRHLGELFGQGCRGVLEGEDVLPDLPARSRRY